MKSSRHVRSRFKSVRKLKTSGVIALYYVHTSKNRADQFTKRLSHNVIDGETHMMSYNSGNFLYVIKDPVN